MSRPTDTGIMISICIPTRNRAGYLDRALSSVLAQGRTDIELIVVDDASDDATPTLLDKFKPPIPFRWIRQPKRLGGSACRNRAIRESCGRYVTGLDDDDEMLPGRLNRLLDALQPGDSFVFASDLIATSAVKHLRLAPGRVDAGSILKRNVVGNQILAERSKVLACGGYDESLPAGQDYDLWIRMILAHGPARGVRRPLQRIHAHEDSTRISRSPTRRRGYWMVYRKHRKHMDPDCRRAHLYNLRRANGHATRLPRDLRFFVPGNRLRLLWHALRDWLQGASG
ncbi:glycosyltransferase [Cognatiluteimonas weifangensis]|uniref:Glycosyltransferase n=1 Tax=Cognatiluteimonas weifangensis TaxID=2303539 RepID=A0A372DSI2_9GAMM|nr:glycosyltransferase [Luteimonas weifangensis]RFP62538.1 glycosyltransferase [Luteimonas weifangensis]